MLLDAEISYASMLGPRLAQTVLVDLKFARFKAPYEGLQAVGWLSSPQATFTGNRNHRLYGGLTFLSSLVGGWKT